MFGRLLSYVNDPDISSPIFATLPSSQYSRIILVTSPLKEMVVGAERHTTGTSDTAVVATIFAINFEYFILNFGFIGCLCIGYISSVGMCCVAILG